MWPQPNEISLIIPHYDRPHHLDLTLKGIERNTEHPKEVIIVEMGIHELALEKYDLNIKIIAHYQNLKKLKPISYCLLTISANYRFVYSHLICCHL